MLSLSELAHTEPNESEAQGPLQDEHQFPPSTFSDIGTRGFSYTAIGAPVTGGMQPCVTPTLSPRSNTSIDAPMMGGIERCVAPTVSSDRGPPSYDEVMRRRNAYDS